MEKLIREIFREKFDTIPLIVRSPGRINILGEHTDYNEGFVLPAAIDKYVYIAVDRRQDNAIMLYSHNFRQSHHCTLSTVLPDEKGWPNYILGVIDQLQRMDFQLGGFNLVIDGNIPVGAGLSSSAAVECATIFAINELFGLGIDTFPMVRMAQLAEHKFAGVKCGIMDQFASMFGKKDHVIKLDCRTLDYEYVPLDLHGYRIVLFNTNVGHELVSTEYNTRRMQCEQGVAWIKEYEPGIRSLRDVTIEMLDNYVLQKDPLIYRRCRYVIRENARLLKGCGDLKAGNLESLGKRMFQTHKELSGDFEVSCKELDFLVNAVRNDPAVCGSRLMGGGFGGCTINIVKEQETDRLINQLSTAYKAAMHLELSTYIAGIEKGTELVRHKHHAII